MTDKLQAEIAKLKAETAELDFRLERARVVAAQADKRNALRERALALEIDAKKLAVANTQYYLDKSAIDLAKPKRDEAVLLSDWRFDHTLNFFGHVGKDTVQATIDKLHMWSRMDPGCAITIVFNSPGGAVIDGLALFDYIRFLRSQGHHITTVALGYAASMGGILLQAGDVRAMAAEQPGWHSIAKTCWRWP